MNSSHQFVVYAVLTIDSPSPEDGLDPMPAVAVRAALQAGLNARVDDLRVHALETAAPAKAPSERKQDSESRVDWSPWAVALMSEGVPVRPSGYDQPIEQYVHSGMIIAVFRNAGTEKSPTYFATISNPRAKAHGGCIVYGDRRSIESTKRSAEAEAPIRYERAMRRAANAAAKAKGA